MQAERDLIQLDILPEIREFLKDMGQNIDFIDLRWGVDTTELESNEGARKVLSVCFKGIKDSKPYLIVLIGERFGWKPDSKIVKSYLEEADFTVENLEDQSITSLEIEYGALSQLNNQGKCFFYFREPLDYSLIPEEFHDIYKNKDEEEKKSLENLKSRIRNIYPDSIRTYRATAWNKHSNQLSGLDELKELITYDLKKAFKEEFENSEVLNDQEKESLENWRWIEDKERVFSAKEEFLNLLLTESINNEITILKGISGSGKSTLMSTFAQELKEEGANVIPFIGGNSSRSTKAYDILIQQIYELENILNIKEKFQGSTFQEWRAYFNELIELYGESESKTLYLLVDAIDQLSQDTIRDRMLFLPKKIPDNVKIVISCLDNYRLPSLIQYKVKEVELPYLNDQEARTIVNSLLKINRKELHQSIKDELLKKRNVNLPLYLSFSIEKLLTMNSEDFYIINQREKETEDGMDAINDYLLNTIKDMPDNIEDLCNSFLKTVCERIDEKQSQFILALLAGSRYGLRLQDLEAIFRQSDITFNTLNFERFKKYLSIFLQMREDNRIDFNHRLIRESFYKQLNEKEIYDINYILAVYLSNLPLDEDIKIREYYYHLQNIGELKVIAGFLYEIVDRPEIAQIVAEEIHNQLLLSENNLNLFLKIFDESNYFPLGFKFFYLYLRKTFTNTEENFKVFESIVNKMLSVLNNTSKNAYRDPQYLESNYRQFQLLYFLGEAYEKRDELANAFFYYDRASDIMTNLILTTRGEEKLITQLLNYSYDEENYLLEYVKVQSALARIKSLQGEQTKAIYYQTLGSRSLKKYIKYVNNLKSQTALANSYDNLGQIYYRSKNYLGALDAYERALDIRKVVYEQEVSIENKINLARTLRYKAEVSIKLRKFKKAKEYFNLSLLLLEEAYEEQRDTDIRLEIAYLKIQNANLYYARGKTQEALNIINEQLPIYESILDEINDPKILEDYIFILNQAKKLSTGLLPKKESKQYIKKKKEVKEKYQSRRNQENIKEKLFSLSSPLQKNFLLIGILLIISSTLFIFTNMFIQTNISWSVSSNPMLKVQTLSIIQNLVKIGLYLYITYVIFQLIVSVCNTFSSKKLQITNIILIIGIEILLCYAVNSFFNYLNIALLMENSLYVTNTKGTTYFLLLFIIVSVFIVFLSSFSFFLMKRENILNTVHDSYGIKYSGIRYFYYTEVVVLYFILATLLVFINILWFKNMIILNF